MLTAIFGSELRARLLGLFLLHPEAKYTTSKLAADSGSTPAALRKELEALVGLGLLRVEEEKEREEKEALPEKEMAAKKEKSRSKKNATPEKPKKKLYAVAPEFILYPELRALLAKAQILSSQKFVAAIDKNFQPKLLVLSGFFTNSPEAQTDILVVGAVKRSVFLKFVADLEKSLEREINFTIMDEKEYLFRQEIMDIFLYNVLNGKTITLINRLSGK